MTKGDKEPVVAYPTEVQVTDIVQWLKTKKNGEHKTTLLLGSRTGGLFRSKPLYSTVQNFSSRSFFGMTRIGQFKECYRILHQEVFSKSDIDTILIASLQGLDVSETDIALAELVKAGIFDIIISTNID